jgi:hypothetical protein
MTARILECTPSTIELGDNLLTLKGESMDLKAVRQEMQSEAN